MNSAYISAIAALAGSGIGAVASFATTWLTQDAQERARRVARMIEQADTEGFGSCSNEGECEAVCPKEIPISNIARMTREYVRVLLTGD